MPLLNRLLFFIFLLNLAQVVRAQSSLYLDGPVKWVNVGDLDVAGDQLTVEALIHYTGASVNIVSKHTNPADVNYLFRIGSFEITTTNGFANFGGVAAAGVTLVPNTTYHLAATYNGQFLRYYVNGCMTGEMAWSGNMVQNNLNTAIGQQSGCQCEQFVGYIDEVRIWNVARTQAEIAANMFDLPTPGTQVGLLAYYKFDGNYVNLQGNATFNGTPLGATAFQQIPYPYPSHLHHTVLSSNPVCAGDANGTVDIMSSGAYLPHQYSLDGVNYGSAASFSNLPAGNYTIFTRPQNNNNCVVSTPVQIIDPSPITPNLTTTDVTCFGANNGSASVNPGGGGGAPYQILWSNGETTHTANNLPPGNHTVEITDSCALAGNELVINGGFEQGNTGFTTDYIYCTNCLAGTNDLPAANYVIGTNATQHHNGFTGTPNGTGGNFMIINGSGVANTNVWCQTINVQPNTYYFFSSWVSSVVATAPAELQFSVNGILLGPILTAPAVVGVWTQFSSTWFSGANTTATICIVNQNTALGGNDFGIDDISFKPCISCTEVFPFTINEPTEITLITSKTDVTCNGGNDGTTDVQIAGGTGNYTISWDTNPVQNTPQIINLPTGTYTVTVTDDNNCMATAVETLVFLLDPQITSVTATDALCFGANDGTITITASGNNLQYSVDGGATFQATNTFNNLAPGNYNIVVEESICQVFDNVQIGEADELILQVTTTDVSCSAACDGSATTTVSGGTGNYTYTWSNGIAGINDNEALNICADPNLSVTVTDANNCTAVENFAITEPNPLNLNIIKTDVSCNGLSDGELEVGIIGGTGNYTISWNTNPVQNTAQITNLAPGSYTVTVTDDNGCSTDATETIVFLHDPQITSVNSTSLLCFGATTGTISIVATGNNLQYSIDGGNTFQTGSTFNNLGAGNYTLVVEENGCQVFDVATITSPQELTLLINLTHATCNGVCDGIALAVPQGGSPGYSYNWSNGLGGTNDNQVVNVCANPNYSLTVTDANGCTVTQNFAITQPDGIQIVFTNSTDETCPGVCDASIRIIGVNAVNYSLDGGITQQNDGIFNDLCPGNHTVTLTDAIGCAITENFTLQAGSIVIAEFTINPHEVTELNSTAEFINFSSGASSYEWFLGDFDSSVEPGFTYSFTGIEAGYYPICLVATNDNGCTDTLCQLIRVKQDFFLFVPNSFTPNGDNINDVFYPVCEACLSAKQYSLKIFDRWGNVMFESNSIVKGWDGIHKSGLKSPIGTYVWLIELILEEEIEVRTFRGHLNLLK